MYNGFMPIRNVIKGTMYTYIQYMYTMAPQRVVIYNLRNNIYLIIYYRWFYLAVLTAHFSHFLHFYNKYIIIHRALRVKLQWTMIRFPFKAVNYDIRISFFSVLTSTTKIFFENLKLHFLPPLNCISI